MIEATRIEQPEVERPDLYVPLWIVQHSDDPKDWVWETLEIPQLSPADRREHCDPRLIVRVPGTRREKLTKERETLIADVVAAVRAWDANETIAGTTVINAARRLSDFDSALLALDAEGVKP